ncbi:MAG: hypothetical protein VX793_14385 [Pseudomonadota bacterium]|nr:hypothetical protein [Pseudomonadota bacterium]
MKYFLGLLLSFPLSLMLVGLLAAALPAPWQDWLVLQLIAVVVLWMVLGLLVAIPARAWPLLVGMLVANLLVWLALQFTPLYGVGA